jgi:predicted GNAT superfamily acetyltransferase
MTPDQKPNIEIRQLFTLDEFTEVLNLQRTIWGFADVELLPLRFLVVVSKVGGHVFGAYDLATEPRPLGSGAASSRMVGFCFAIPGVKAGGHPYLHSHMLGVLPEYHNAGIGRRLKLRQREEALGRGIQLIEWTFDPLELKNAFFNIERLGAIVRRYNENQYGLTASPLHGGLPTDRCIAEWWIDSARVRRILDGERLTQQPLERISYPADIARIRAEDRQAAREIQQANGRHLQDAFVRGLAATGFDRTETHGTYLLEPYE